MRLTKAVKDQILKAAKEMSKPYLAQEDLKIQEGILAEKIRAHSLGGEKQAHDLEKELDALNKTQEKLKRRGVINTYYFDNAVKTSSHTNVRYGNDYTCLKFYNNTGLAQNKAIKSEAVLLEDAALIKELQALENKKENNCEQLTEVIIAVRGYLNVANTKKQLLALWPEAKELIPEPPQSVTAKALTVPADKINNLIGLPSKKGKRDA